MYITITITAFNKSHDVQIDNRQQIRAAAEILQETGRLPFYSIAYYRSRTQQRIVSAFNTFEQENIQTGDELSQIEVTVA